MTKPAEFPKTIYAFWMQGRKNAPEIVEINFDRWQRLNPDYELIVLDKESAQPYMQGFSFDTNKMAIQTFSDILRLRLLRHNGGVWTDASTYPTTPLSVWLAPYMERNTFFAYESNWDFHDIRGVQYQAVINWFMAARVGCPIVDTWGDLVERYWSIEREFIDKEKEKLGGKYRNIKFYHPEDIDAEMGLPDIRPIPTHPYFWPHHLFGHLLHHNAEFAALWNALEPRDYPPTQVLQEICKDIFSYRSKSIRRNMRWAYRKAAFRLNVRRNLAQIFAHAPMQKLDWRQDHYPLNALRNYPL